MEYLNQKLLFESSFDDNFCKFKLCIYRVIYNVGYMIVTIMVTMVTNTYFSKKAECDNLATGYNIFIIPVDGASILK